LLVIVGPDDDVEASDQDESPPPLI